MEKNIEQQVEQQVTRGLGVQPTQTQKSFQFPGNCGVAVGMRY